MILNPNQKRMIEMYQAQIRRNRVNKSEIARAVGFHPSYVSKTIKEWRAWQKAPKGMLRGCLCCNRSFVSRGRHNRLCDGCKDGGEYQPYSLSLHSGGY